MLSTVVALTSFSGAPVARSVTRAAGVAMETREDLKALAVKCNPTVGYWDPLDVCEAFGDYPSTETATVGWFRHAEIKHGRVAMAAFVGFCVQSNGIHFPWGLTGGAFEGAFGGPSISFGDIAAAGGPLEQWQTVPELGKLQILSAIFLIEHQSEWKIKPHYMAPGGVPGSLKGLKAFWDPFGFTKKMSEERKEKALLAEVNNGRLAMIGIFGVISASKGLIVPGLDSLGITPYAGEYMAPFTAADSSLPFVEGMAALNLGIGS